MYDTGRFKSADFELPVIVVGNLNAGGSGKTPMVEYLSRLLNKHYEQTGILSRGYRRRSSGFILANEESTAWTIGDEPMQLKKKFPDVEVAVCENRSMGIPLMLMENEKIAVIILDDAFQHRRIRPGLSVLLTDYQLPFYEDELLPLGRLRENAKNFKRADAIVITKCPAGLTEQNKKNIIQKINPFAHQEVFFASLTYYRPYHIFKPENKLNTLRDKDVLLLCGIAKPKPIRTYLGDKTKSISNCFFNDHHYFTKNDLEKIKKDYLHIGNKSGGSGIILTTEKDAVRLLLHEDWIKENQLPVYVLPVRMTFGEDTQQEFDNFIVNKVKQIINQNG